MIEINLSPGASRKSKGRGAGLALAGVFGDAKSSIKDPFLIAAVVSLVAAAGGVGMMHVTQTASAGELATREEQAVADSTRFAAVLKQRRSAEAKRDSVLKQLEVIKAIDADRFIWPHVMDEVSRALPPYTWLKTLAVAAPQAAQPGVAPAPAPGDTTKPAAPVVPEPARFRLVGNTVDIQALTRFMKLLESSPFIQKVQLARSEMAMVEGKEVTEFILEAQYERPDSSMIITTPVSLSVR
jgi:Tfp pilus assembly protein PilN